MGGWVGFSHHMTLIHVTKDMHVGPPSTTHMAQKGKTKRLKGQVGPYWWTHMCPPPTKSQLEQELP